MRRFDVSGMLGVELAFNVGTQTAIVGARYDHGFVNIGSTGKGVPTKNRSGLVHLGWLWAYRSAAH